MDNKEIALQITLHAMDNGLIDTTDCWKDRDYASGGLARSNADNIIDFYRYVLSQLDNSAKEYQLQE